MQGADEGVHPQARADAEAHLPVYNSAVFPLKVLRLVQVVRPKTHAKTALKHFESACAPAMVWSSLRGSSPRERAVRIQLRFSKGRTLKRLTGSLRE